MKFFQAFFFILISGFLVSSFPAVSHLKKNQKAYSSLSLRKGIIDSRQLRSFERRLAPFFEMKANGKLPSASENVLRPTQEDFFIIAKHWARLSDSFKKLFTRSTQIPGFMKPYRSPGGYFEIYYAIADTDSVGADTVNAIDKYGFNPLHWRERTVAPNGIPDYIDEVALAFDSAWSMEIDRFGFVHPLPFVSSSHSSSQFKVIVRDLDFLYGTGTYGMTTPVAPVTGIPLGFASYIELRNDWRGFEQPDYTHYPEQAVRVTAVHEFFHSIQYAMIRQESGNGSDYQIDDFPLSWLEGTAVLMENIGFDSVNDFIQYSNSFFIDPTNAILNNADSYVYTTVLLAMFLYECLEAEPSIEFIKRMFFNNYNNYIEFSANLDSTSKSLKRTWTDILGDFFTQSYYSGSRARPGYFIHDAPLLSEWPVIGDSFDIGYSINKDVPAFGMETFLLTQKKYPFDEGIVSFLGSAASSAFSPFWSVHCILQSGNDTGDSVFSLPVPLSGRSIIKMADWSRFSGALIIVSNANDETKYHASLVFEPGPVVIHAGDSTTVNGAIAAPLSKHSSVSVAIKARSDLACSLTIESAVPDAMQLSQATNQGLVPINDFYSIVFPITWAADSALQLTITEGAETCLPLETAYEVSSAAFAIFRWDEGKDEWMKCGAIDVAGDIYRWQCALLTPGLYGVYCRPSIADSQNRPIILACPNPVRKNAAMKFRAEAKVLMQLLVYSMKGALIYRWETQNPTDTVGWNLVNTAGKRVVPGMYCAYIGYRDTITKGLKKKRQKILIVP